MGSELHDAKAKLDASEAKLGGLQSRRVELTRHLEQLGRAVVVAVEVGEPDVVAFAINIFQFYYYPINVKGYYNIFQFYYYPIDNPKVSTKSGAFANSSN